MLFSVIRSCGTIKSRRRGWSLHPSSAEISLEQEASRLQVGHPSLGWSIALGALAVLGSGLQVVRVVKAAPLPATLCLASWVLLLLFITLTRPRYCPTPLLLFYLAAFVTEAAKPKAWPSMPLNTSGITTYGTMVSTLLSIAIILCMHLRPAVHAPGPISTYGSAPSSKERSVEDSLRLWQFLTMSWVSPLLVVAKERQIDQQDVWARAYEYRNEYIAKSTSDWRGSTLLKNLLKVNAVDTGIVLLLSAMALFCGRISRFEILNLLS